MFHDPFAVKWNELMDQLTKGKKPVSTIVPAIPYQMPEIPKLPPQMEFPAFDVTKIPEQAPVDDKYWPIPVNNKPVIKYEDDWDTPSNNYITQSVKSSKYDDDYEYRSSSSSSKYDKYDRKERYHTRDSSDYSSNRESRHRRERDDRRDRDRDRYRYRSSKEDYRERDRDRERSSRKDRDYYEYSSRDKDNHRYGGGYGGSSSKSSYSRNESYSEADYGTYDAHGYGSYIYSGSYPPPPYQPSSSAAADWAPPPPPKEEPSPPRPPPEPPGDDEFNSDKNDIKMNDKSEDGETTVDLDTRIAMLFKTKSFGSEIPSSFFNLDDDSGNVAVKEENTVDSSNKSNDEQQLHNKLKSNLNIVDEDSSLSRHSINNKHSATSLGVKVKKEKCDDVEDGEVINDAESRISTDESTRTSIPSPFESRNSFKTNKNYLKSSSRTKKRPSLTKEKKINVESGASDISSSEDELIAKGSYSPALPSSNKNNKYDKSTIKDDDQMSLSSLSSTEPIKTEADIKSELKSLDASASYMYPMSFSSYPNYYYQQQSFHHHFQHSAQQWHYDASAYYHGSNYSSSKRDDDIRTTDDPHEVACKKVVEKIIQELKQILKKDFNKRMIENTAYKKYEAWWDEQERSKNTRNHQQQSSSSATVTPTVAESTVTLPQIAHPHSRDPLLDSYQQSGSLGILRNFRIQRIKREPVTTSVKKEDLRKSDDEDEDMVHGSDSEKEDILPSKALARKISSSSSSSDSSDSDDNTSSEEEEEEEDPYSSDTASLMSDDEISLKKITPVKKDSKENNRIYSDSDSDEIIEPPKPVVKQKMKIYSDSEDEDNDDAEDEMSQNDIKKSISSSDGREKTPEGMLLQLLIIVFCLLYHIFIISLLIFPYQELEHLFILQNRIVISSMKTLYPNLLEHLEDKRLVMIKKKKRFLLKIKNCPHLHHHQLPKILTLLIEFIAIPKRNENITRELEKIQNGWREPRERQKKN